MLIFTYYATLPLNMYKTYITSIQEMLDSEPIMTVVVVVVVVVMMVTKNGFLTLD